MFATMRFRSALLLGSILASVNYAGAAVPADPAARAAIISQPTSLVVQPQAVVLAGPRAMQQIVVTGKYGDGSVRDLTPLCDLALESADVADLKATGFLTPKKDGSTALVVKAGNQTARVPILVKETAKPQPISFRNEVIASLNVGGCNQGACHGTPSGKNGFKLSLRGYDPAADYLQLTRDVLGRRTDRLNPQASLILNKGLGRIPHEGGQRFQASSVAAQSIAGWLAEGLNDDPANLPTLQKIEVIPGPRVFDAPARFQQLAVLATFSDGAVKDVTRLTVFSSSDSAVADVSPTGLVEFGQSGEVAVLCRYLEVLYPVRLMYLEPKKGFAWNNPPENNFIDKHVFAKLKMLDILPSDVCTDQEFIRRIYMDVCGILPTGDESKAFLADQSKDKRA